MFFFFFLFRFTICFGGRAEGEGKDEGSSRVNLLAYFLHHLFLVLERKLVLSQEGKGEVFEECLFPLLNHDEYLKNFWQVLHVLYFVTRREQVLQISDTHALRHINIYSYCSLHYIPFNLVFP